MVYISSSSVRPAVDFPITWLEQRPRLVKTEKGMAGKTLSLLAGIKHDLITSRRVLNTLARVSGKGIFDCEI